MSAIKKQEQGRDQLFDTQAKQSTTSIDDSIAGQLVSQGMTTRTASSSLSAEYGQFYATGDSCCSQGFADSLRRKSMHEIDVAPFECVYNAGMSLS